MFLDKVKRSMDKRSLAFAWIWTRETGLRRKGDHAHIMWHLHNYPGLTHAMRRWISEITGKPYVKGALETRTIGLNLNTIHTLPAVYQENLKGTACYVLKGVSRQTAERLGLTQWDEGGRVIGQRSGSSLNLRKAAKSGR
jgi:hypothetical protein